MILAIVCDIIHYMFLYLRAVDAIFYRWRCLMKVRYDKLWRLMKDNQMKKSELAKAAEISSYAMTKLNHDRPVSMEIMINLRKVFHCDIGDLMEVIED